MSEPINGIKATLFHDEGAIAQCGYCQRYTLDRRALSDRPPTCDCRKQHGWSGSFKKPTPESIWFGDNPPPQPATIQVDRAEYEQLKRDAERLDYLLPNLHPANFGFNYDELQLEKDHNAEFRRAIDRAIVTNLIGEKK